MMIVLGIAVVAAGISVPIYRNIQADTDLAIASEHEVQALRQAKTYAQSGKNNSMWGVYVPEAIVFAGDAFSLRDPAKDETYPLAASIDTSGIDEVTFSPIDGLPSVTGVIRITTSQSDRYQDITIDKNGFISLGPISTIPPLTTTGGGGATGMTGGASSAGNTGTTDTGTTGSAGSAGTTGTTATTGTTGSAGSAGTTGTSGTAGSAGTTGTTGATATTGGGTAGGSSTSSASAQTSSAVSSAVTSSSSSVNPEDGPSCDVRFALDGTNLLSQGTNDVKLKVLGSQITYGVNGPKVAVRVSASTDGGINFTDLYTGKNIDGGEEQTVANQPSGTSLVLKFNGRYSWVFNRTYRSDIDDGHVIMLRNGDTPPNYPPFANQQSLQSFLKSILDSKGKIKIGANDVVYLVELGALDSNADFQDAVLLVSFIPKPFSCNASTKARVKIQFDRSELSGNAAFNRMVYVGPQTVVFNENQWIPLIDDNNQVIIDGGIVKSVGGISLERGNGWIRVLSSKADAGGKKILDVNPWFNHAYITSYENGTVPDASENPQDAIVNDSPAGDEFSPGPNAKSMKFATRVESDSDSVIIRWLPGEVSQFSSSSSVSSSSSAGGSASSSSSQAADQCLVPYTLSEAGTLIVGEKSDITFRIAGSESTYGERGPRISVRARISFDGGVTWQALFGSRALRGGEIAIFRNVPAGSSVVVEFEGRYSWLFKKVLRSGTGNPALRALRSGQNVPPVANLLNRIISPFLATLISSNNQMQLNKNTIAFLTEMDTLDATADFEDAVALLSIDKPSGTVGCNASSSSSSSSVSSSSSSSSSAGGGNGNDTDADGVKDQDDLCANTAIPEIVPTQYMGADGYALTEQKPKNSLSVYRYGARKVVSQYSIKDTRGCSCDQLLNVIDNKVIYRFNEYPTLYNLLQGLFAFYVDNSRKFGCGGAIMRMMADSNK